MIVGANTGNFFQIIEYKIPARFRPHIQMTDSEINGVGASLDSRHQRFVGTYRSHDLYVLCGHVLDYKLGTKIVIQSETC
jgi:hypothetical protein